MHTNCVIHVAFCHLRPLYFPFCWQRFCFYSSKRKIVERCQSLLFNGGVTPRLFCEWPWQCWIQENSAKGYVATWKISMGFFPILQGLSFDFLTNKIIFMWPPEIVRDYYRSKGSLGALSIIIVKTDSNFSTLFISIKYLTW